MVKKIINKPHLFFFGLIPIFVILGIIKRNTPINLNISYIYYLINVDLWCYISAVFLALIGLNYLSLYWVKKPVNKWLTIMHIFLQIVCLLPYFYAILNLNDKGEFSSNGIIEIHNLKMILAIAFLLFLISLLIHLINFFSSLFLKRD